MVGWPPDVPAYGYSKERSEHEEIWQYLFHLGRMQIGRVSGELLFSECDTESDHRTIVDTLYPAIAAREGRAA